MSASPAAIPPILRAHPKCGASNLMHRPMEKTEKCGAPYGPCAPPLEAAVSAWPGVHRYLSAGRGPSPEIPGVPTGTSALVPADSPTERLGWAIRCRGQTLLVLFLLGYMLWLGRHTAVQKLLLYLGLLTPAAREEVTPASEHHRRAAGVCDEPPPAVIKVA